MCRSKTVKIIHMAVSRLILSREKITIYRIALETGLDWRTIKKYFEGVLYYGL